MTPDEARKVLAEYASALERYQQAVWEVEQSSLSADSVDALGALKTNPEWWADEWLELHPLPKKGTPASFDPTNTSRLGKWLAWRSEQDGLPVLGSRRIYQLEHAYDIRTDLVNRGALSRRVPERVVRPIDWFRKNRMPQAYPAVWNLAVHLAGDVEDAVTFRHTSQAVAQYKKEQLGSAGVKSAVRKSKAARDRAKAIAAIETLRNDGDQDEWDKFIADFKRVVGA